MKKLAIITGGTSGIGFAIAEAIADTHDLALNYAENDKKAEEAISRLSQKGCRVFAFKKKLLTYQDVSELYESVYSHFRATPCILLNSIGKRYESLFLMSDHEKNDETIHINLNIAMYLSQIVLENMMRCKFGRIVHISSVKAQYLTNVGSASYSAAKAGLEGFTRALAKEVAMRGVTVNAIAPGLIETDMTNQYINEKTREFIISRIPVRFLGQPHHVAEVAKLLISESASYITGQVICVDGGISLGGCFEK